jgi:transmembrane sensor
MSKLEDEPLEQLAPLDREAQAFVARFAAGEASAADLQALKLWHDRSPAHAAAFAKASDLWARLGVAGQGVPRSADAENRRNSASVLSRPVGRRAVFGGALAASAAAVGCGLVWPPLGLWPSLAELTANYRTATGERKKIILAGVSIDMSAGTSIIVRARTADARHLELVAGEAAVTTAPAAAAAAFVLSAGNGRTIALRASFDVRHIGANVCVTCLEGEIRVEQGEAARLLQSRQQLVYSSEAMSSVRLVDPSIVTAWRSGVLVFHGTPLGEAIEEINRYRPGKIILINEALGERIFNARFRLENIGEVVEQIQQVFGARVTALPGGIVLLG